MTTPLVTLQKPKDVSLDEIEAELKEIWAQYKGGSVASSVMQPDTFCMVVYEPEEFQQLLATLGFYDGPIDGIHGPRTRVAVQSAQRQYDLRVTGRVDPETLRCLRDEVSKGGSALNQLKNEDGRGFSISDAVGDQNPRRIVTLCPTLGEDTGVTAQVSAYCPVQKNIGGNLLCCEYITLRGTKQALDRVGDLVTSLMMPDLPKFVWWKATPNPEQELFKTLAANCNCIVVDSSYFSDAEAELLKIHDLQGNG
ncbi:MAG: oxidoreductase, partial [Merismopedia sp. SIO2A8]|nr:oxidoreductase [Merismopedia sp. SIO2A8]